MIESDANARMEDEFARRRDLEDRLRFSNTVLSAAMEGSIDGILVVDEDARIISYNQRFLDMWNIPPELAQAGEDQPVLETVTSRIKYPEPFLTRVKYLYEHPEQSSFDRLELKNERIFERYTRSLYDADRKYVGRIWFFRDITEQENSEKAIRSSEEKFRTIFSSSCDGFFVSDADTGRFIDANEAGCAIFGYARDEIIGRDIETLSTGIPPYTQADALAIFKKARSGARQQFEWHCKAKDGRVFWAEISLRCVSFGDKLVGLSMLRDITERKRLVAATEYRGTLLRALAAAAAELLTTPTLDRGVPEALRIVGQAVRADRVIVLEACAAAAPVALRYWWNSPGAPVALDPALFSSMQEIGPELDSWFAPVAEGKPVTGIRSNASGPIEMLFERLQIKSNLAVPIILDGKYWGQIGFDDCRTEREWSSVEIDILRTLSDLVGTSIMRARYVKELTDANLIVQNTPTILYRLRGDPALPLIYVSRNIRLFGYDPAEMVATPLRYKSLIHPDDLEKVNDAVADVMKMGSLPSLIDFRFKTSAGDYRWVEARYSPVRDADHRLVEVEGILIDITERKHAEEKIALLARTDALTGLANRATFIDRLRQAFAAAQRGAPGFAVLYLDIDRFKDINDTLGHPSGDLLLKIVAERMRTDIREIDVVARLGGDEFAVLQANASDSSDAGELAAKIRRSLARPCQLEGSEVHITASVGISVYSSDISGSEDMLAQADMALYRAKEEGRDQYRFHSEQLDRDVRGRVAIADELRLALEHNEFELYYQPQVEFATSEIVGMEALVRWNHPTRGLLKPADFIPIAERTGTIIAIGQWVLEQACGQMSQWQKENIAPKTIAVNVSLAQIKTTQEFIQGVTDTLARWNLAPADLEFDVTESILAHATLTQNDVLERLQKLGIRIAIDDFGTQYSSLDYVKTYRVNRLKIPQSLIEAARRDGGNAAMVRAIIGIARELKVEIVAQGVETEAQWSFLTKAAPNAKIQGYYYSKPVSADRAAALLQRNHIAPASDQGGALPVDSGPYPLQPRQPAGRAKRRTRSAAHMTET